VAKKSLRDAARPGWFGDGRPFVATAEGLALPLGGPSQSFLDPRRGAALKNVVAAAAGSFNDYFLVAKGATAGHRPSSSSSADVQSRALASASQEEQRGPDVLRRRVSWLPSGPLH
jgi:hypothetical protein